MNCLEDLGAAKEKWFFMEGGGKVQLRTVPPNEFRKIQKATVRQKVDFKKVEGTPSRLPYEVIDTDLQNEMFWDYAIVSWNEFSFKHPETKEQILCTPATCTKENKMLLITQSSKFLKFANDSMKELSEDENKGAEVEEKN
jgi:hypothetical protein